MIKKLLLLTLILTASLSFGQTHTVSISSNAADELVVSENGFLLNKSATGELTQVELTITSVLDFTGVTEPAEFKQMYMPMKTAADNKHVFKPAANLQEGNVDTDTTVGEVRTRTWVISNVIINPAATAVPPVVGDVLKYFTSGGIAGTVHNPKTEITIVESFTAPLPADYIKIESVNTTIPSVERGADFNVSFVYDSSVAIDGLTVQLWIIQSGDETNNIDYDSKIIASSAEIKTLSAQRHASLTATITFPTDISVTSAAKDDKKETVFNIVPTASLPSAAPKHYYQFRFILNTDNGQVLENGTSFKKNFNPIDIQAIEEATAGVKDYEAKKIAVFPNPTTDFISIENATNEIKSVTIFNVMGKQVKTFNKHSNLDVSNLAKGIYLLKTNTGRLSKFIKE
ncbi:T9SS type A sorting domain-containing protein [Polaribacter sp. Q13]|uniref:T9SS type A sorting domain-containing protein n=1 Tax=Polaribacter sp. Q13 TaxID=2806551 RepID=UPI00193B11F8|nr:T9SS type A sorting domain-containing protein [Polaribacter sp. Q13]QVY66116.1 T9SS type A sorting domain-containing protein [Polaribacter sp. Q13]